MIATYSETLLGERWVEIEAADCDSVGPSTAAPAGRMTEITLRSSTNPLLVRLGGMAGDAKVGWLGRLIFPKTAKHLSSRKSLEGAVITYGASSVRLGFHGRGDREIASQGTYEVDLAFETAPGVPRTMAEVMTAIATELDANAATASVFRADSKQADSLYIFDAIGPQALTITGASGIGVQPLTPIGSIALAVAEMPFTLDLARHGGADTISIWVDAAAGADLVIEVS